MAVHPCPRCREEAFTWANIDPEGAKEEYFYPLPGEPPDPVPLRRGEHTYWICSSCGYVAWEDEAAETACSVCPQGKASLLWDDKGSYWWCPWCWEGRRTLRGSSELGAEFVPSQEPFLAKGVRGFLLDLPDKVVVTALHAETEGSGDVGRFLDWLPHNTKVTFPNVLSERLAGMLIRRGFEPGTEDHPDGPYDVLKRKPSPPLWVLEEVQGLLRRAEPSFTQAGYAVGLTGSVLLKGLSHKDLDLLFYPLDAGEVSKKALEKVLAEGLGWKRVFEHHQVARLWLRFGSRDTKYVETWQDQLKRRIDVFYLT
jgi:hypothetical protein